MVQFEREFIREEFRSWKQEFVDEFADMLYRRSPGMRHP
jgi:hypothetical protein